jgi:rhamnosyltransferase
LYFNKENGHLASLLDNMEVYDEVAASSYGEKAKKRIAKNYTWKKIINDYESLFLNK